MKVYPQISSAFLLLFSFAIWTPKTSMALEPVSAEEKANFIKKHTPSYLAFFQNPTFLYTPLVSTLERNGLKNKYEQQLLKAATNPYQTPEGLKVNFLGNEDFLYSVGRNSFAFHGTRATLEILG